MRPISFCSQRLIRRPGGGGGESVRTPGCDYIAAHWEEILRLRGCFASLRNRYAQDDRGWGQLTFLFIAFLFWGEDRVQIIGLRIGALKVRVAEACVVIDVDGDEFVGAF